MTKTLRSRASYSRTLIAICKRLDEQHSGAFTWKHPCVDIALQSRFTVNRVWVVGSFARGTLTCGDLDLVAEIDWHGSSVALPYKVFRALSLRHPGVSLYDGTPYRNSSLVAFSEAILIWDRRSSDWQSAIDSIVPDPNATRFSRAADAIPFRPEHLACGIEEMNDSLELRDQGFIKWDFTPFGLDEIEEPPAAHQPEIVSLFASCGVKTKLLLRHLLPFFHFHQWPATYRRAQLNRNNFQLGDSVLSIGRPKVDIKLLSTLTTARLMIVPHMRSDAVNGVWCIERGDLHPLTLATERLTVWALSRDRGQLDIYARAGFDYAGNLVSRGGAVAMDLFTSLEVAQNWIVTQQEESEYVVKPVCLTPRSLLSCIAAVDIVSIDLTDYPLTYQGALTLGVTNTVESETLFDALGGNRSNSPALSFQR